MGKHNPVETLYDFHHMNNKDKCLSVTQSVFVRRYLNHEDPDLRLNISYDTNEERAFNRENSGIREVIIGNTNYYRGWTLEKTRNAPSLFN